MSSRQSSARKSPTDEESVSKASNGSRRNRTVISIPPPSDDEPVGRTAGVGRETKKENATTHGLFIPVERDTPTMEGIAAIHHQGLRPTSAESFQQTRQAQPSYSGYRQDQGMERPESYAPERHDRSAASMPATPFNYSSLYSSYMPQPPANHNESVRASSSAPPFSYPAADITQTQSQPHYFSRQNDPVPAPAPTPPFSYPANDTAQTQTWPNPFPTQDGPVPAPVSPTADYFTPYQEYQPAQTYAPRSYTYTGPQYPAYNSQSVPRAAPGPDDLHQWHDATPFPTMVPPVIPPMATYYPPYARRPSIEAYAFVANDPWRPHIRKKRQKDVETFDEVPLPSASRPPWMPHGRRPRMASPHVPPPVIPPVYRPPTEASEIELVINPYPTVPELPPSNGSSPRIHRPASPIILGPVPPPPPLINIPSPRRSSTLSSSMLESVRSDGQWETSSPVVDPVSHAGRDGELPTKLSSTSWATEIISHPSDNPTTPAPPAKTLLKRVANIFKKTFKTAFHKPGNLSPQNSSASSSEVTFQFIVATLPSQVYLNILLRLPSLYFSRVARIFEEADLTLPELKKMALETASQAKGQVDFLAFESNKVPEYDRLKATWESFIDSVMREWKTFNIISVLLLSAILTILQIESAADDPVTRYAALFSMICALVSLLFGCMYIIRFGTMRKTYKAAEWALEAKKSKMSILWNVWVMLAMPAIWLTWSIILYIACIMSFIWRTSPQDANPPNPVSATILLVIRTVISSILGLGLIYGALILRTFRRYGEMMDRAWKRRIDGWIEEKNMGAYVPLSPYGPPASPYIPPGWTPPYQNFSYPHQNVYNTNYYGPQFVPPVPTTGSQSQRSSNSPVVPRPDSHTDENHPSSPYANAQPVTPPNRSPRPKTPVSIQSTLNLDREDINRASTRQRSTDSYSIRSNEGSSTSDVPAAVAASSFRSQGRRSTLAVPPAKHLPPIPGTPSSTSAASPIGVHKNTLVKASAPVGSRRGKNTSTSKG